MRNLLGFPEFKVLEILEDSDDRSVKVVVEAEDRPNCCHKCGSVGSLNKHQTTARIVEDLPMSGKLVYLEIHVNRYKCRECGQTFVDEFKKIVDERDRMTYRLVNEIADRCLKNDTFSRIAEDYSISDKTVRRVFDAWCARHAYVLLYKAPRVLGLDEAHIDKHFRLVVTDTENKQLLDMLPDNSYDTVYKFLNNFKNKNDVKVATMDFAPTYANAVKAVFPFAVCVIDKFHVIQLLNRKMDTVRKQIHDQEKKQGKNMKRLKNERTLFMANMEDLPQSDAKRLSDWLNEYPRLEQVYFLKEQFREIYNAPFREKAEEMFDAWCKSIPKDIPEFVSLRKTFQQRREHIFNYFDFKYTNAYTESINNYIKQIEKAGKGYRFEVLRARALFSSNAAVKETRFKVTDADYHPSTKLYKHTLIRHSPVMDDEEFAFSVDLKTLLEYDWNPAYDAERSEIEECAQEDLDLL